MKFSFPCALTNMAMAHANRKPNARIPFPPRERTAKPIRVISGEQPIIVLQISLLFSGIVRMGKRAAVKFSPIVENWGSGGRLKGERGKLKLES